MPSTYPSDPSFPEDGGAERAVWDALREQLPDDAVVFHGVRLQDGEHEHEIDLLVAWPGVGIAAIEVKGGFVVRRAGAWLQGADRHRIDPVGQVQGARHALQDLLREQGVAAAHARTVHLVAFKGLERPVVVLAVNGFRDVTLARRMLYTGMSRSRSLLVVVGRRGVVESVGGEGVRRRLERAVEWDAGR